MPQSDGSMTKVPIMANDHQHLLEATRVHGNTDNVILTHQAFAVECHSKRVLPFTV